ncbi:MAG TPA: hypothetical protein VLR26_16410 [Frankiaceae bacterium]|nr:hypothetical protein [Frankiaceae bacterium]
MTVRSDMTTKAGPVESDALALDGLVRRLAVEFPTVDEQDIVLILQSSAAAYRDVRITQYVGVFVERESRERLREIAVPAPRLMIVGD